MRSTISRTPRRINRSASLLVVLLIVGFGIVAGILYSVQLLAPLSGDIHAPLVLVTIPSGKSAKQIGEILARRHLIRHAYSFVLASRLDHLSGEMHAGNYRLSPAMPPRQMAALMALGEKDSSYISIPEGFTVRQIAHRLAVQKIVNENEFLRLAEKSGRTFHIKGWTPPNSNLEGYLFPDSYDVEPGKTPREIIEMMLENFHSRVVLPDSADANRLPGGLTDVMTLASLVEREAEVEGDRPLIAAVYWNRLKAHMRLQCDATVQYALPEHKARLFYSDLRVDSPYNTYRYAGLPPTPIANPGIPSIEAALHPASVPYLFYVAGPGGKHLFSTTLAAHERAIALVRAEP